MFTVAEWIYNGDNKPLRKEKKNYFTWYITFKVRDDRYLYCDYITAENKEAAKEILRKTESELETICNCEIAY